MRFLHGAGAGADRGAARANFRREWRLAAERTLDIADDHLVLLPIVIDDTDAATARVPEKFQSVQWLKVPDGQPTPVLETLCRRLAGGDTSPPPPRASSHPGGASPWTSPASPPTRPSQPSQPSEEDTQGPFKATPFPTHEPGQGLRYGVEIIGWSVRNTHGLWRQLPRWIRWGLIVWAVLGLMSRCSSDRHDKQTTSPPSPPASEQARTEARPGGTPVRPGSDDRQPVQARRPGGQGAGR